jgi:transglutaminase-like putative cysteine protease
MHENEMTLTDVLKRTAKLRPFSSDVERCVALHDFVRDEISFGFTSGFESVSPEQTLTLGRGHCNAQADLFRTLLESADIPARLRFVKLDKQVLRYAVPWPVFMLLPSKLFHAVTEVWVNEIWVKTDSYIFQPYMFRSHKEKIERFGLTVGFGLTEESTCEWDAITDAFSQARSSDLDNDNPIYSSLQAALNEKAGNNRLLGIHFNQWLKCIPSVFQRASERYLNSRLEVR